MAFNIYIYIIGRLLSRIRIYRVDHVWSRILLEFWPHLMIENVIDVSWFFNPYLKHDILFRFYSHPILISNLTYQTHLTVFKGFVQGLTPKELVWWSFFLLASKSRWIFQVLGKKKIKHFLNKHTNLNIFLIYIFW